MFKEVIAEIIAKKTSEKKENIASLIEIPPKPEFGDFSFPCFSLAPKLHKSPNDIARELSLKLKPLPKEIEKVEVAGAYINFFINKALLVAGVIKNVLQKKEKYGENKIGENKKIMIEYSSPNTNKPLHLGHLKNDSIGMSLAKILKFSGYKVIKASLLNDRGMHICKVMYAYGKLSKQKKPKTGQKPDHFIGNLYVLFEKEAAKKPRLNDEIQKMLQKWEARDKKTRELWKKINSWVEKGIFETYKKFGSKFDVVFKESQFYNRAMPIIKDGLQKKIFTKEDGAIIAKLDPLPNKIVLRKDGTAVYITNDLALTKHKFEKYKLDKSIWVTGSEQKLYFEQLFRILFLLGFKWHDKCRNVQYGMVLLESGKMKSREGNVVDADDIISDVTELAKKEVEKREKLNKKELEKRARAIALAAIKFYLLRTDIAKDVLFEPEKAVSFEGYTGPYLQYAYARACNILKKAGKTEKAKKADFSWLKADEETHLVKKLSQFEETIKSSAKSLKPDLIANYAFQLCRHFANFYEKCPVIKAEGSEKEARLALVSAFKQVLANALHLLNIETLERM